MSLYGVAARQGEAERSGSIERNASELLVKRIHAGTRSQSLSGEPKSGKRSSRFRRTEPAGTADSRPGGGPAR